MAVSAEVRSFSLTKGTTDVLRLISEIDERKMSAEVRHLIRSRAHALIANPGVSEHDKLRLRELMNGEEFAIFRV